MHFDSPASDAAGWMPALLVITVLPCVALLPIIVTGPIASILYFVGTYAGLVLLLLGVWRRMKKPMRYRIEGGTLIVPAYLKPVQMPIATTRVCTGPASGWKVSGTAVPPYCLGLFADGEGTFHMAATAPDGVWVRGDQQRVFVTPADIPGFVAAMVAAGARVETASRA